MEFEPGSELESADELRQAQIAGRWKSANHKAAFSAWSAWSVGWPLAKKAVMEAESEVQQFAVSWAEAWERAEARAWAEVKATLGRRVL